MSFFCEKCGNQLSDGQKFCTQCGTPVTPAEPVAPAQPEPVAPVQPEPVQQPMYQSAPVAAPAPAAKPNKVKEFIAAAKQNPKKLILPVVILVALIAALVVFVILPNTNYKQCIDDTLAVLFEGETGKLGDLAPDAFWDYYEERYEMSLKDLKNQLKDYREEMDEEFAEDYGKNWKVSYKVLEEEEMKSRKLGKLADALEEQFDIDAKDVTKGYEVEIELTIKGSEDKDSNEMSIACLQIDGKWYACTYYEYDGEYNVNFMFMSVT